MDAEIDDKNALRNSYETYFHENMASFPTERHAECSDVSFSP